MKIDLLKEIMKKWFLFLFLSALVLVFFAFLRRGMEYSEIAECVKWREWAKIYEKFYLVEWQEKQCNHYGIIINAPVFTTEDEINNFFSR